MYKIIFEDDDPRYAEPLLDRAPENMELDYFDNWEEAFSKLIENFEQYDAIIIDGKSRKTKEDKGDDFSHVLKATQDLSRLQGEGKYIPYVVLSKYLDVKGIIDPEIFFEKGKDEDRMFSYLEQIIKESPVAKLKSKYPEAFKVFDNEIMKIKYRHNLIEMLNCLENNDYKKKNMNVVRDLLESFFLTLIDDYDCIPEEFKNSNNKPNQQWCTLFFAGKDVRDANGQTHKIEFKIPDHISWSITYIKELTNGFSHINENENLKNNFTAVSYAMIEVLEWLHGFINKNYE
mgnify:CR=1 FL=1